VSFVAPAGWAGNVGGPNAVWTGPASTGDSLSFQLNPKVFTDPCHPEQGAVAMSKAPTADELVKAITGRPDLANPAPTSTALGGLPATSFTLMLKAPLHDCSNNTYVLWQLPLGATNELQPGMSEQVWVVDVKGLPLVVEADSSATQQAIHQVLDSLEITPAS
jgi:hypothetical protein